MIIIQRNGKQHELAAHIVWFSKVKGTYWPDVECSQTCMINYKYMLIYHSMWSSHYEQKNIFGKSANNDCYLLWYTLVCKLSTYLLYIHPSSPFPSLPLPVCLHSVHPWVEAPRYEGQHGHVIKGCGEPNVERFHHVGFAQDWWKLWKNELRVYPLLPVYHYVSTDAFSGWDSFDF